MAGRSRLLVWENSAPQPSLPEPPFLPLCLARFGGGGGLIVLVLAIRDTDQVQILFLPHTSFVVWGKVLHL